MKNIECLCNRITRCLGAALILVVIAWLMYHMQLISRDKTSERTQKSHENNGDKIILSEMTYNPSTVNK